MTIRESKLTFEVLDTTFELAPPQDLNQAEKNELQTKIQATLDGYVQQLESDPDLKKEDIKNITLELKEGKLDIKISSKEGKPIDASSSFSSDTAKSVDALVSFIKTPRNPSALSTTKTDQATPIADQALSIIKTGQPTHERTGVKTYETTLNGKNCVIRKFEKNAKFEITHQAYLDRLKITFDAALKTIDKIQDKTQRLQYQRTLKNLYNSSQKNLEKIETKSFKNKEEFSKNLHKPAMKESKAFFSNVTYLLSTIKGSGIDSNDWKSAINEMHKLEVESLNTTPRPTIIHFFEVGDKTFFSKQEPVNLLEHGFDFPNLLTETRNERGLSNFVTTSFGVVENEKTKTLFEATRNTSYNPIAISDPLLRNKGTIENAKLQLAVQTKKAIDSGKTEGNSKENPISISLDNMSLLTPQTGDTWFRDYKKVGFGEWRGESEQTMLLETQNAFKMLSDRPIQVKVPGQDELVWIKVNFSMMNVPSNDAAFKTNYKNVASMQHELNAQGFLKFEKSCLQHIESFSEGFSKLYKFNPIPLLADRKQQELNKLYEEIQQEYEKSEPDAENIKDLQGKIDAYEKIITDEAIKRVEKQQQTIDFEAFEEIIPSIKNEKDQLFLKKFLKASKLFYTKGYQKKEHVFELQTLFLTLLKEAEHEVNFGCKSGKDRTGINNDATEVRLIKEYFGFQPIEDSVLKKIVHTCSASKGNVQCNIGTPHGMKPSLEDVDLGFHQKIEKKHGNDLQHLHKKAGESRKRSVRKKVDKLLETNKKAPSRLKRKFEAYKKNISFNLIRTSIKA